MSLFAVASHQPLAIGFWFFDIALENNADDKEPIPENALSIDSDTREGHPLNFPHTDCIHTEYGIGSLGNAGSRELSAQG